MKKIAVVLGGGGFIGSHLIKRLKKEGYWVRGVDLKRPEFGETGADNFLIGDLRNPMFCEKALTVNIDDGIVDEVYQLAADMGGAGFVFTGENDFDIQHNSGIINLNVAHTAKFFKKSVQNKLEIKKIFYSSSACIYPERNQLDPENPNCAEDTAYPAAPDSEYGWEKLFSERIYKSLERNYGVPVRIARFHNIFGPEGTWDGGREKAPAAMSRKAAETPDGGVMEVWGKGNQTRSFMYVDECLEAVRRFVESDCTDIINIGSDEMISINNLAKMAIDISGKNITIKNIEGPLGVQGRNSDNKLIEQKLGWRPTYPLRKGMEKTYHWINEQVKKAS